MSTPLPTGDGNHTMAPLARQLKSLQRLDIHVTQVEIEGWSKLKYLQAMAPLYRALGDADVVHGHYGFAGWLARLQLEKPVVVSFMGSDLLGYPDSKGGITRSSAVAVKLNRWFARTVSAAIVKSPEMARIIEPVVSHVVPNGIDLEEFAPLDRSEACARLGWAESPQRVLFAGSPDNPRKGFPLAQAALDELRKRYREPIEVVPLHRVAGDRVPVYMSACDVMILTSHHEGSPNVVKEAMACNLPVVSVPVGDVEALFDEVKGYAVVPREPGALAEALVIALTGGAPVEGRAAIVEKKLDLDSVAQRLASIYQQVLP